MTIWPLISYSDISTNQTFHQFHDLDTELDLHRITSGFRGAFATGVTYQQGTLNLQDTLGLAYAQIVETSFPELSVSFLDFSPWIPLGTLSFCSCSPPVNPSRSKTNVECTLEFSYFMNTTKVIDNLQFLHGTKLYMHIYLLYSLFKSVQLQQSQNATELDRIIWSNGNSDFLPLRLNSSTSCRNFLILSSSFPSPFAHAATFFLSSAFLSGLPNFSSCWILLISCNSRLDLVLWNFRVWTPWITMGWMSIASRTSPSLTLRCFMAVLGLRNIGGGTSGRRLLVEKEVWADWLFLVNPLKDPMPNASCPLASVIFLLKFLMLSLNMAIFTGFKRTTSSFLVIWVACWIYAIVSRIQNVHWNILTYIGTVE